MKKIIAGLVVSAMLAVNATAVPTYGSEKYGGTDAMKQKFSPEKTKVIARRKWQWCQ